MTPAGQLYIDRTALCRRLGISRATSYRLVRQGFLPRPVAFGPATLRWPVAEVEEFERRAMADRGSPAGASPLGLLAS